MAVLLGVLGNGASYVRRQWFAEVSSRFDEMRIILPGESKYVVVLLFIRNSNPVVRKCEFASVFE